MTRSTASSSYKHFTLYKNKILWCGTLRELKDFGVINEGVINEDVGSFMGRGNLLVEVCYTAIFLRFLQLGSAGRLGNSSIITYDPLTF